MFRSDVYVLGLLMIECGLLVDLSKELEPDLSVYLQNFQQNYSEELYKMVEEMLDADPKNRPTFAELKEYLIREIEMNTTKVNDATCPLLSDLEDSGSDLFALESLEQ